MMKHAHTTTGHQERNQACIRGCKRT